MIPAELPPPILVALLVTGAGTSAWGVLLALRTTAKTTGALMAAAGAATITAVALAAADHAPGPALAIAGTLLALAVMAYPKVRLDWPNALAAAALIGLPVTLWAQGLVHDSADVAVIIAAIPLLQLWWRLEGADPGERKALAWVLAACVTVCFTGLVVAMLEVPPPVVAMYLPLFLLIGCAAWVGTTRPGAIDVRGLIAALATNTLAAVAVFTIFQLSLITLRSLGAQDAAGPVAGVVAVACAYALQPLRVQLRLVADEILFGIRPDALTAAGRVASGVGDEPQTALDTLRTALVLPYAELQIVGLRAVTSGTPTEHTHREPLHAGGQPVGELLVGLRPGDLKLNDADATVLSLAGPLLAQTVRERALTESLKQSRAGTAAAREEERRRLRRDLHDGLGPRLSGIAFTADAAQLSTSDPERLAAHLRRIRSEAVTAIREIRELVYGLRPPALDEVGLLEAIRLQAASLRGIDGHVMHIEITGSPTLDLPAAVEVAAYRIAIEALTNSARHSAAERACASLHVCEDTLHLTIEDTGPDTGPWTPGVGITSMTERAQELGGTLTLHNGVVHATLPIQQPPLRHEPSTLDPL